MHYINLINVSQDNLACESAICLFNFPLNVNALCLKCVFYHFERLKSIRLKSLSPSI